eukprot:TRINITY_DN132_c1_g1_i3.p2 TRINITY_DN132_c1_g1~~TRINITY_DN132_c1_g1_i3.p2  ORF type:complete len:529 (+),score=126.88 TRINITY_DN132_c1_g1_i3:164-1588(+)
MDRPEFEALIAPLLEELAAPCQLLLKQTGLAADALSAVEVIGGSSRVPAVKTTLTQVFGRELSWTLNTSESIARGCGLLGAVLSPAFMVKEFEIHDTSMYAINLSWRANSASVADMDVDGSDNASQMFTVNNAVPSVKQITFPRADSYELVATYAEPSQVPGGVGATVATFQLPEVPAPSSAENKSKVKVKVRLNWFGVVAVDGAQLVEELPEEETPAAAGADGKPVEKKVKVRRVDINVVTRATGGRTRDEIKHMTEEERAMELRDQEVAATADAKNAVESYVYDMRNKLTSNLQAFIAADDRTKFSALMDQTESWLYDEGDDTTKDVYMAKLQSLKAFGNPVERRFQEDQGRASAVQSLESCLNINRSLVQSPDEKYSHIESSEREKLNSDIEAAGVWVREQMAKQSAAPKFADPTLTVAEINSKRDQLDAAVKKVMNKPKPAPVVPPVTAETKPADAPSTGAAPEQKMDMD